MISRERVCVEVTDQELRWLWYSLKGKNKNTFAPVLFEITPLPQGIIGQGRVFRLEEFRSILVGYLAKRKAEGGLKGIPRVSIGLSLQNQFIRQYSLPWVKKGEQAGLLHYLAEEEIPIPKDELIYDYFVEEQIEGKRVPSRRLKVVLSGIRESFFTPLVESFKAAGFAISKVGFSQLAWGQALGFGSGENVLLLREDEGQVQYIFYRNRIPEIIRSFPMAVQNYGQEEWDNELHRMLLFLSSLHDQVQLSRILWAQGRETENAGKRIGEYLRQARGSTPPLQAVEEAFAGLWKSQGSALQYTEKLLTVLGLALEDEEGSLNNFWRGEISKQKKQRVKWIAAGVILMLNLGGLGMLASSQQSLHTLRADAQQISERKNAEVREEEKAKEQRRAWEMVAGNSTQVGRAVRGLTAYDPGRIRLERIELKGQTLLIQGCATESLEVQKVFQQLKGSGWEKVQLAKYQLAEDSYGEGMPIQFTFQAETYQTEKYEVKVGEQR